MQDLLPVIGVVKMSIPGGALHLLLPIASGQFTDSGILITLAATGCLEGTDAGYAAAEADMLTSVASAVGTGVTPALLGGNKGYLVPTAQSPGMRTVIT